MLNFDVTKKRKWTFYYFHSTLWQLSIIHTNFTFLIKYAQSHNITESVRGTRTDRWSADYSIDQSMVLLPSTSCLHGSHAVEVAARHGRGISWYPSHGMRSTLQWDYCSLACDAHHVTWSDGRPGYISPFRNLMPSLRARRTEAWGIHYSTVVKTTAGRPLTVGR